ncbi:MAG: efflux RND transporter permease subunit [Bradymonadaceae bacterium]
MNDLASLSVRRPVVAVVMAVVIMLIGALGYWSLGVREFPAADSATVSTVVNYPGAGAEVIENQITEPLESEINSIEGLRELESVSRQGRATVTAEFYRDVDLDRAANDVRDRVSRARGDLPPDANPPVVRKQEATGDPVVYIKFTSETLSVLELTEIANNRVVERLQTITGVASVQLWGSETYTMRLWMNPRLMAAHDLTPHDVRRALENQNFELPAGRIDGNAVEVNVKAPTRLATPEDFNNLILKDEGDTLVRFEDVGYATYGSLERREILRGNGEPMMMTVLNPQPGANEIQIADQARSRLENIREDLPSAVTAEFAYDGTDYIRRSIDEVQQTIALALLIVIAVIFLFLGYWRTTLIPVLVIPVSIIGAFGVMSAAGFSINVLTLLAIVLAMGIVVDDAIVVLENVYSKIEEGMSPRAAGIVGTREVFFAVVATTLALVVVFFPILFMGGLTGELFTEFGVVLAGTVLLSSFSALTVAPMLCAKLLEQREEKPLVQRVTDPVFDRLKQLYSTELAAFLRHRWLAFPILLACGGLVWHLQGTLPSELAPKEDRGVVRIFANGPQGVNFEYMDAYMTRTMRIIQEDVPERSLLMSITSPAFGATGSVNSGFHNLILKDRSKRQRSAGEIAGALQGRISSVTGAQAFVSTPATIGGSFGGSDVQFVLQNLEIDKLREVLPDFLDRVRKHPAFQRARSNLKFNQPEYHVRIDRDRARTLDVPLRRIGETLSLAMTPLRNGFFLKNGKQYDVVPQLPREDRDAPADFRDLYVENESGELISLADLVTLEERAGPPIRFRYNRYSSATIEASLAEDYVVGQGVKAMNQIADDLLDDSFSTALKGQTKEYAESTSGLNFAFALALLMVYLVLSAQFESFRDSFAILLSVPLALTGALAALWYFDQTLNVFSQIGMIMLIGLVTKNGILIVEFANQKRAEGLELMEAAKRGAEVRFRPVLMTALSTTLGVLPIALALGAGAESRIPMGIAVIGGMVVGTFLTLFVVPAMYTYLASSEMSPEQREAAKVTAELPEGFDA